MIYKYTTCEAIIAKIMSDLDMQFVQQRISDIKEWIFEGIDKIGAATQYEYKESGTDGTPILVIKDYQVPLPDDLARVKSIAYSRKENGPWQIIRSNTSSFKNYPDVGDPTTTSTTSSNEDDLLLPVNLITVGNSNSTNFSGDVQYFIKPGYICTNARDGYIKLAYDAILTDSNGYPLIPDLTSYQEALYWYTLMKLKYPEYLRGTLNREIYYDIRRSWNFYRNQAYAEAIMPDEDQMISIKNEWLKLVPEINEEDTFFSNIGQRQHIYNNYHGRR